MLKKYLEENNISIYKLSEISNIPYTTLNELVNGKKNINDCKIKTIEGLAHSINLSIEALMNLFKNNDIILSNSWEECKDKVYYFPIIVNNENYDASRIHPLKQKKINEIYNITKNSNIIDKIIIFGSSVNIRCNKNSDIDIAVKIKDQYFTKENQNMISEKIGEITEYYFDMVWLNTIDKQSQLYYNIENKGVIIYE